jgi:hypothetical protein
MIRHRVRFCLAPRHVSTDRLSRIMALTENPSKIPYNSTSGQRRVGQNLAPEIHAVHLTTTIVPCCPFHISLCHGTHGKLNRFPHCVRPILLYLGNNTPAGTSDLIAEMPQHSDQSYCSSRHLGIGSLEIDLWHSGPHDDTTSPRRHTRSGRSHWQLHARRTLQARLYPMSCSKPRQ